MVDGLTAGLGVWATHFVAMTAYDVGLPLGFALLPLLGSLAISFAAQTTASWLSHRASTLRSRILAGVLSGGGIIAMHYLGMIGLLAAALRQWNGKLIGGSVFLALVLASFAFAAFFTITSRYRAIAACGVHCSRHSRYLNACGAQRRREIARGRAACLAAAFLTRSRSSSAC